MGTDRLVAAGPGALLPGASIVLLLACAYAPLLAAGLLAPDYARLLSDSAADPGHPLGTWWLAWSRSLFGIPAPGASAWPYRLEALLVWIGVALAARIVVKRLLESWLGSMHARAAGFAAATLLVLHPAVSSGVASLGARGELAGLLLGTLAAAAFLRGRQEGREALTIASFCLLLAAGFATRFAPLFALGLSAAEYASVKRHRRRSLRRRTAATTLALFATGAALPLLLAWARATTPESRPVASSALLEGARERVVGHLEQLGELVLPVDPEGPGLPALLAAGALLFLALLPGLRAARNAPRLWGGMLVAWSLALITALAWALPASAPSAVPVHARGLPALFVTACGLGLTASAVAGSRARVLLAVLAVGFGALTHLGARPFASAASCVGDLARELGALDLTPEAPLLVLDVPRSIQGIDPLGDDLGWLFHPALRERADALPSFDEQRVRGLSTEAFLAFTREPEFAELRRESVVVLAPGSLSGGEGSGRLAVSPGPGDDVAATLSPWRKELTHVVKDGLDPCACDGVRIFADLATPAHELEVLGWRNRANVHGSRVGLVSEQGGELVAFYDLSRSLAWRLAGRVGKILVEKGAREIARGEFFPELPALEGITQPRMAGADWLFPRPALPQAGERKDGRLVLTLLDLGTLAMLEIPLAAAAEGMLGARGAQRFVAGRAGSSGAVAWALEYRIGDHCLARVSGRIP